MLLNNGFAHIKKERTGYYSLTNSEGGNLLDNPALLLEMFIPLLIFFGLTFFIAQGIGRMLGFPKKDIVALNFTTLARNSPLSLAIAVATFPGQPFISLALVIGPLIELPVLSIISGILLRWNEQEKYSKIVSE